MLTYYVGLKQNRSDRKLSKNGKALEQEEMSSVVA